LLIFEGDYKRIEMRFLRAISHKVVLRHPQASLLVNVNIA